MTATASDLTYTEYCPWGGDPTVHRILVIAYHDGRPSSVVTDHGWFDFSWCRRDGTLNYHESGSGMYGDNPSYLVARFVDPDPPPCKIWTAPGVGLHAWISDEEPKASVDDAELLARGYVRLAEPLLLDGETSNPFEAGEEHDGHMEHCSICDDDLPDDDLCDHLYHSSGGGTIGAGAYDEPRQESVFAALDWLATAKDWRDWQCVWDWRFDTDMAATAVHMVESMLLSPDFDGFDVCCIEDDFAGEDGGDDWQDRFAECEDGLGWLTTLGPGTPAANARTLHWIMCWRLKRSERR